MDKRGQGTCRATWYIGTCRRVNKKMVKIYYTKRSMYRQSPVKSPDIKKSVTAAKTISELKRATIMPACSTFMVR